MPPDPLAEDPPLAEPGSPLLTEGNADESLVYGTPTVTAAIAALSPVDPTLGVPVTEGPSGTLPVTDPPDALDEDIEPNCPWQRPIRNWKIWL